jgi:hypothetical protein
MYSSKTCVKNLKLHTLSRFLCVFLPCLLAPFMTPNDLDELNLKSGDKIKIWIRFVEESHEGEFVLKTENTVFWRQKMVIVGTAIRDLVTIERMED